MSASNKDLAGTVLVYPLTADAFTQGLSAAGTLTPLGAVSVDARGLSAQVVYYPVVTGKTGPNIDSPPDPGV